MPTGIASLPFDVLFCVVEYISLEDAVHLALTCRQLSQILKEATLCRKVIEVSASHSREAAWALAGTSSYEHALQRLYQRRSALRRGAPSFVLNLGRASTFIYSTGVLCYLTEAAVVVRDLHSSAAVDAQIELEALYLRLALLDARHRYCVQLLYFAEGVLAVRLEAEKDPEEHYLAALRVENSLDFEVIFIRHLPSINDIFVRHTAEYLYYGTHDGVGENYHHEWVIHEIPLIRSEVDHEDNKLQLQGFVGSELGATVDFMIYEGNFYAVSNQTSFVVEEVDWTSFFTAVCFPVGNMSDETLRINRDIYRRQHAEGPIHDSWTTLELQHDEASGLVFIVESRREWLQGGSKQTRTFYTELIWFSENTDDSLAKDPPRLPANDLFSTLVTSDNNPRWAPGKERTADQVHPEYGREDDAAPSFIFAKTKSRSYNLSCSTFLDLVEDASCCRTSPLSSCMRLRTGTRRPNPSKPVPVEYDPSLASRKAGKKAAYDPYRYSTIQMWPPVSTACEGKEVALRKAHDLMNPHLDASNNIPAYLGLQVIATSDERSLVYMVKPARPRSEAERVGTIVLVAFDSFMVGATLTSDADPADNAFISRQPDRLWSQRGLWWPER